METRLCSRQRAWKPNPAAGVPRSVELLAWVCLGGNGMWVGIWGAKGWGIVMGGVPADAPGELLPESSPRSRVEGKSPGNGSVALRGAAHAAVPWECLRTWWRRSCPYPKSRGVQSLARGSPRSRVWGGKRVSRVLQHTVGCGMGQIQPHPGKEHGTGTGPAFPLHWGHSGTPALGLPLCPTPHPGSTQLPWWHRVKSCPNLFLAVLQLGINGLGRQLGNASCAGPSPFAALPVSKFPLQTSIF